MQGGALLAVHQQLRQLPRLLLAGRQASGDGREAGLDLGAEGLAGA